MALVICITCGHPFTEHEDSGCADLLELGDDGYSEACPCEKTADEVLRQIVPTVEQARGEKTNQATEASSADRWVLLRSHMERGLASPAEVDIVFAELDRLTAERDDARAALQEAEGREAALSTELGWQRHRVDCGQCNMHGVRPLCPRGNGLFSAMVDAAQAVLAAPERSDLEVPHDE